MQAGIIACMSEFRGMNDPSASEQDGRGAIPRAKRVPKERTFHGDAFIDQYEWLRDKESQDVRDYVAAQNRYCEWRMKPLESLRKTLFDEFKSHVQETDMSVPTRMDGYWYFTRTKQGEQYATQCRVPIRDEDDWDPPTVEAGVPLDGEQVVFDTNAEAEGHDFFRIGGMDISKDGRWMLYGTDTSGDERYDFRIRDLETGEELSERFDGIGGACFTPDAQWVFYVLLDDAWRPYAVKRHRVGTPVADDVEVYHEADERFWVGIGLSFDERNIVIGTGSKTTTEVLLLSTDTPEGEFQAFIPRETDVEYDVSFSCFEGAGENGEDIPLAVVYHNALNPNFEIDVIDMRTHEPPYRLGEGTRVAVGSPYGCEHGDDVEPVASSMPIGTPYSNPCNPAILQGAHGLGIEGISIHRHFVALQYRAESLPHVAVMTKTAAAEDFLAGRPWRFTELVPHALEGDWDVDESVDEINVWGKMDSLAAAQGDGAAVHGVSRKAMTSSDGATADRMPGETRRLYSIGVGGNPSYDAPRMRYSFASYTRPGELHDYDPATGEDRLLKRATVLGGFDPRDYMERRVGHRARRRTHPHLAGVAARCADLRFRHVHHRLRRIRDQLRSGIRGVSHQHARPWRAVRRAAHPRWRRNGPRLVRAGASAQQEAFVRGLHRRHTRIATGRIGFAPPHGGERRLRGWPAHGRGRQHGPGMLCGRGGGRAVRGRADLDSRPVAAVDRHRMGRVGRSAA